LQLIAEMNNQTESVSTNLRLRKEVGEISSDWMCSLVSSADYLWGLEMFWYRPFFLFMVEVKYLDWQLQLKIAFTKKLQTD
jgi:hypothetical protein